MRHYLSHLASAAVLTALVSFAYALWAEPLSGDLTRIGYWTEREFGANMPQPSLEIMANSAELVAAQVLVLGDSFSEKNAWQSVIARQQAITFRSYHYNNNCLTAWVRTAIDDPASTTVLIETIERSFLERFARLETCSGLPAKPLERKAGQTPASRATWPPTMNSVYLLGSALNTANAAWSPDDSVLRFGVVNARLREGCGLFSHRQNQRLLYYAADDAKRQWTDQDVSGAIRNVLQIQQQVERSGKKFLLIVAPDKSSVYRECLQQNLSQPHAPDLAKRLLAAGVRGPDLVSTFQAQKYRAMDLYEPNDTHWSARGYVLAAQLIGQHLSRAVAPVRPPQASP